MQKAISAYLIMTGDQLWMATPEIIPGPEGFRGIMGFKRGGFTMMPLPSGLPKDGVNSISPKEFQSYLDHGYAYEGTVVIKIDEATSDVSLKGGFGMRVIEGGDPNHRPTREEQELFLEIERAADWMSRMSGPAISPDAAVLAKALRRLEEANDALAAERSQMVYDVMIGEGLGDRMAELDGARREARETLRRVPPAEDRVPEEPAEDTISPS